MATPTAAAAAAAVVAAAAAAAAAAARHESVAEAAMAAAGEGAVGEWEDEGEEAAVEVAADARQSPSGVSNLRYLRGEVCVLLLWINSGCGWR